MVTFYRHRRRFINSSGWEKRRITHGAILSVVLIAFITLILVPLVLQAGKDRRSADASVAVTFGVNFALGLVFLLKSVAERPFSLVQVHWLFFMTFFVVVPIAQYAQGYFPWGYYLTDYSYIRSNLLLFVWGTLFGLSSDIRTCRGVGVGYRNFHNQLFLELPRVNKRAACLCLVLGLAATLSCIHMVGFENLFSRSTYDTGLDKTTDLIYGQVVRGMPVFSFVYVYICHKQSGNRHPVLVLCAAFLLLIADFPFGLSRFRAAMIYGGIALLASPSLMQRKGCFPLAFLVLFLVVFPAANTFRTASFEPALLVTALEQSIRNLPYGFCAVDYDAYSYFARSLDYVDVFGSTAGRQLLTCALFFVPRTVWPGKAEGSGATMALAQNQVQTNVSCPLPGEGVMNFGIAGIVGFACVFGLLCGRLDRWFFETDGRLRAFYPMAVMEFFFMMRGDLLSSYAYLVGYLVVFLSLHLISRALRKRSTRGGHVAV